MNGIEYKGTHTVKGKSPHTDISAEMSGKYFTLGITDNRIEDIETMVVHVPETGLPRLFLGTNLGAGTTSVTQVNLNELPEYFLSEINQELKRVGIPKYERLN